MADLLMLKFDSAYGAHSALAGVRALEELQYAWIDDVATVEIHKHGRVSIHTPHGSPANGAWWGALGGMLVFLWFPPAWFLTAAVGGAALGAGVSETMKQAHIDHDLTDRAKSMLTNNTSALLLVGVTGDADEMAHAFEKYEPTDVIRESIPDHVVKNLVEKLSD